MTEIPKLKDKYENYIGGKWEPPVDGKYFENTSPTNGEVICRVPQSNAKDINKAIDAAHLAAVSWTKTSVTERTAILNKIADRIDENLPLLAAVETLDNGKALRETTHADLPLTSDHFRYFASIARAEVGEISNLDNNTVTMEVHEPLGVVAQIIPWNFPILMATWKIAPALAAGNCIVLKPAEQTPASILVLIELIEDLLPPGVLNVVNGFGPEAGKPLAASPRVKKVAFTGETTTGRFIMQYASENLIPVTMELGGKSPNIFCKSIMNENDDFLDKAIEGFVLFALNQGEVCTCPSRALVDKSIYDKFMEKVLVRVNAIKMGSPFNADTMMGAQASNDQYQKIINYLDIGKKEGAKVLAGGDVARVAEHPNGYYVQPTVFEGHNKMRIFQEEIFGPVVSVTPFNGDDEALAIANDTIYGLGAGVWTRDTHQMHKLQRGIEAGRIWSNCYHLYPAGASFGGYKKSGFGRENHKMMLNHYRNTKNILVSYDKKPLGFF